MQVIARDHIDRGSHIKSYIFESLLVWNGEVIDVLLLSKFLLISYGGQIIIVII